MAGWEPLADKQQFIPYADPSLMSITSAVPLQHFQRASTA